MISRKFYLHSSQSKKLFLGDNISSTIFITSRFMSSSPKSPTGRAERNLMPKHYFVGGKSPSISVPKQSRTQLVNSPPTFANAGFVDKWRDVVLQELDQSAESGTSTKISFSSSKPTPSTTPAKLPHPGSMTDAKFKCSTCGNIWRAKIRERNDVQQDIGCPHCLKGLNNNNSNTVVGSSNKNKNAIAVAEPEIAQEWDLGRNKLFTTLQPENASIKSEAQIWWICNLCAGSFVASVKDRVEGNVHCPTCVDAKLDPTLSKKDNATMRQMILKKEHTVSNDTGSSDRVEEGAIRNPLNKIDAVKRESLAPWTCTKCGSAWKGSSFAQRSEQHTVCPSCSGQVVTAANSLTVNRPDVVASIVKRNDVKNVKEQLKKLTTLSKDRFWFQCWTCKKEYEMAIRERCEYGMMAADGSRYYGKGMPSSESHHPNTMNPCPHCQRVRRVVALENVERGGIDGYVSANKVDLRSPHGRDSPLNSQHISTRALSGPN